MIGIIGVISIETEVLKSKLENPFSQKISGIEFTRGTFANTNVVVGVTGSGKAFAAMCAEIMVLRYSPDYIINIGNGHSLSDDLKIGDVAIADNLIQHDMDRNLAYSISGINTVLGMNEIPTNEELTTLLEKSAKSENIHSKKGLIATGDKKTINAEQCDEVLTICPDAIASDCEAGSVAQVCAINRIPFGIIKTISMNVDGTVPKEPDVFKNIASGTIVKILERVIKVMDR